MPTFITRYRQVIQHHGFTTTADPCTLQGKQLATYNLVRNHLETNESTPLRMVVAGTAGTGKSYLIDCLRVERNSVLLRQLEWQHSILMGTLSTHSTKGELKGNTLIGCSSH